MHATNMKWKVLKFYSTVTAVDFVLTIIGSQSNESFSELENIQFPNYTVILKFTDSNGYHWFPQTINNPKKGMIFADGTDKNTWKWVAVLSKPIDKKERHKFPPRSTRTRWI
jgi:hypothetical protein